MGGAYFQFNSSRNGGKTPNIFYRCSGDPANPAIVMGHGWPTSSFDFQNLVNLLDSDYHICTADYVGHGFSDKHSDATYSYSMFEHAEVVKQLVTSVVPMKSFTYLAH